VTANARHHHDELRALGADTEVEGEYDVILELVGGENLATNLEKLALKGRISIIGTGAGSKAEIEFRYLMAKRGRILASHLRNRTGEEKAEVMRLVGDVLARNHFTVPVHATFPLEQAQEAYEAFARGGKYGKLVICP
jgi:NADPH:quinone reductase